MALTLKPCGWYGEPPDDLQLEDGEEVLIIERRVSGLPSIKASILLNAKETALPAEMLFERRIMPAMRQLGLGGD